MKRYLKDFTALTKRILKSEEATSKLLFNAGVHDEKGDLTSIYKRKEL